MKNAKQIMALTLVTIGSLIGSKTLAQEPIDQWYGRAVVSLIYALDYHQDDYSVDSLSDGSVSIIMTDYRGVACEYVAMQGEFITHRIDYYSKQEYTQRLKEITSTWEAKTDYYVLQEQVIAVFSDKKKAIAFIPIRQNGEKYYNTDKNGLNWKFNFK